jgi:UDP-N-acetylglucosamine 2-epimerase (non-hydrolysing)
LLNAVGEAVRNVPVVFPVHPRTAKTLAALPGKPACVLLVGPQPYLEFNYLVRHARGVITDSGGVTEETTVMGVPCVTLRDTTERPETVTLGTNELIGTNPSALKPALDRLFGGQWKKGSIPEKWDGRAGERIAEALEQLLC